MSVKASRGEDICGRQVKQAHNSLLITTGIAALITTVEFINAGIFTTLWVSERLSGLALRRAIRATPGTITIARRPKTALMVLQFVAGFCALAILSVLITKSMTMARSVDLTFAFSNVLSPFNLRVRSGMPVEAQRPMTFLVLRPFPEFVEQR